MSSSRIGIVPGLIIAVLAYLIFSPAPSTLSAEKTTEIMTRLGRYWLAPSPPVIMFATPG